MVRDRLECQLLILLLKHLFGLILGLRFCGVWRCGFLFVHLVLEVFGVLERRGADSVEDLEYVSNHALEGGIYFGEGDLRI